jgi:hypothetical protein
MKMPRSLGEKWKEKFGKKTIGLLNSRFVHQKFPICALKNIDSGTNFSLYGHLKISI